jgi:tRNA(adenine34) deaminase
MLALKDAYEKLGSLEGCTLYVTLEPCAMCAGAMIHMRLPRLVYGAFDPACGCCGSRLDLGDHWFDHSIETIGGVLEEQCSSLLKDFFRVIRIQ